MKRLAILLVATVLLLALSGLGVEDRRTAHRAVSDTTAWAASVLRNTAARVRDWRDERQVARETTLVRPVEGSGLLLAGTFAPSEPDGVARLGAVTFQHAEIRFARGLELKTGPHRIVTADQAWSASGVTYAQAASAPSAAQIEVRRVVEHETPSGLDTGCGPGLAPGWVAIRQQPRRVTLMLFRGETPPGDALAQTALCGVWTFDAEG